VQLMGSHTSRTYRESLSLCKVKPTHQAHLARPDSIHTKVKRVLYKSTSEVKKVGLFLKGKKEEEDMEENEKPCRS
jgi:hypothetical protein